MENFVLVGTLDYMDPQLRKIYNDEEISEQEVGEFDYFKNDVFSLGLTLLRACTLESISNCNTDRNFLY